MLSRIDLMLCSLTTTFKSALTRSRPPVPRRRQQRPSEAKPSNGNVEDARQPLLTEDKEDETHPDEPSSREIGGDRHGDGGGFDEPDNLDGTESDAARDVPFHPAMRSDDYDKGAVTPPAVLGTALDRRSSAAHRRGPRAQYAECSRDLATHGCIGHQRACWLSCPLR